MSKKYANQFLCSQMILPEHRAALGRHRQEQAKQHYHPLFDQQQWEQFQALLERSYFEGVRVRVTTLEGNGYRTVTGVVQKMFPDSGMIELTGVKGRQRVVLRRVVAMAGESD